MMGRLVLQKTGTVLAERAHIAVTVVSQLRGFIGRAPGSDEALGFPRCPQVHTFGVPVPIDVAFCDAEGRVLHCETLPPRRVSRYVEGTAFCWETRVGGLVGKLTVGDGIAFLRG